MREAIDAGIVVGENRIQEALDKKKELNRTVEWHLINIYKLICKASCVKF